MVDDKDKPYPPLVPGRCNARIKKRDNEPYRRCRNKPHIPDHMGGNGRCKFHGGLNTGPRSPEARRKVAANPVTHGAYVKPGNPWLERLKKKYDAETQGLWDNIPIDSNLAEELRATRLKLEHLTEQRLACVTKLALFFRDPGALAGANVGTLNVSNGKVTPPETPEDLVDLSKRAAKEGLYLTKTFELMHNGMTLEGWLKIENETRDLLRRLAFTQHEISPGGGKKGNLHFTVSVTRGAADQDGDEPIPDLAESRVEANARQAEQAPSADPVSQAVQGDGLTGKPEIDNVPV